MLQLGGQSHCQLSWLQLVEGVRAAAAKRAQGERGQKDGVSTRLSAPKSVPARPFPKKEKLGPGWNRVVRGGRVVKAQATKESTPNPSCAGGQTRGRAAPTYGQPKLCRPGAPVVDPQPPQPKHTDSSLPPPPNHRVSRHSRGSSTSSTIFPLRPA
jgi:hypothetical protein